jgi:hypothetical protein
MTQTTHETYSREETPVAGSDRAFGLVICSALLLVSGFSVWRGGSLWPWSAGLAAIFLVLALGYPAALSGVNRLWLKFGLLLHKIVNPVVMAFLFYGTVLPTGVVMRALGKDVLRLKRQPQAGSYWIARQPPGPSPETMNDQF